MSSQIHYRIARPITSELIDMAESGMVDWETLARDMLNWVSEQEVHQMAESNGYILYEEDDENS